jgi:creatinine amidohydrolase
MTLPRDGLMQAMTWTELAEAAKAGVPVVLPIGATEQHGPHLPLGTDCYIPTGVALEVGKRLDLVVAPAISFGARSRALSGGGETFPGTLSLRAATLIATIQEVLCGLARSGFTKLCVYNWHYENAGLLWEACDLATERHPDVKILLLESALPVYSPDELKDLFPHGFPGWDVEHASIMETSLMYVLAPELVRRDRIVDDGAARHPSWDVVPAPVDFIPASGVLWRPSEASPELGHAFLTSIAARLEDALRTEFAIGANSS